MVIKKNEKFINYWLEKYKDYGEVDALFEEYIKKIEALNKKYQETNETPSYFEREKLRLELDKKTDEVVAKRVKMDLDMRDTLTRFSQEMLVAIYNKSTNVDIKYIIYNKILKNDGKVESLDLYLKSGYIFEYISGLSLEQKIDLYNLRETDQELIVNDKVLSIINPIVRGYLFKSMNGNLVEEKKQFYKDHNLNTEREYEFYKDNILKAERTRLEEEMNAILEIEQKYSIENPNKVIPMKNREK